MSSNLTEAYSGLFSENRETRPEVRSLDERHERERSSFL
jgi:hypothetical protein